MKRPVLVLLDLQRDFLGAAGLQPPPSRVIGRAAALLAGFRAANLPVLHAHTTIRSDEERLPHWRPSGRWDCREGTSGHAPPEALRPGPGEEVLHKRWFSAFADTDLRARLRAARADGIVLCGVHLHACVRATALDAYQAGLEVWIAADAVAGDDALHGAQSQRYLEGRAARFFDSEAILGRLAPAGRGPAPESAPRLPALRVGALQELGQGEGELARPCPARRREILWRLAAPSAEQVARAAQAARQAGGRWRALPARERRRGLEGLAALLGGAREALAQQAARELGKPLRAARGEVDYAIALIDGALRAHGAERGARGRGFRARRAPPGVIAAVTPFNNPVASLIGKAAPALLFGNTVAWKPAPAASGVAQRVMDLIEQAPLPAGAVSLLCGDSPVAAALLERQEVDAISLTGSCLAGAMAQVIASARAVPLQAELGGNNAAIVLRDADLDLAAAEVAQGAFGSAGQRCTANRRVIVEEAALEGLLGRLLGEAAALPFGAPWEEATQIGPLVSERALQSAQLALEAAEAAGAEALWPRGARARGRRLAAQGFYHAPVLALCRDPQLELVREETFAPILVVQPARDLEHALALLSGPRQGLSAALFSGSRRSQRRFLAAARTGLLKLDQSTVGGNAAAPFGGWGTSGIGPAEHGPADAEFFGRWQTVFYRR